MKRRRIQGWMLLGLTLLVFNGCESPSWFGSDSDEIAYDDPDMLWPAAVETQFSSAGSDLPGFQTSPTLFLTNPATGFVPTPRQGMGIDPQLAVTLREEHLRTPEQNIAVYKSYIDQHGPGADPLPFHRLAVAKTQAGLYRDATKYFRFALRIAPDDPVILSDLGYCCYIQDELGDAEDVLRMAASVAPYDPRVNDKLAHIMALEGRYEEAAIQFQQTMSPANAYAHLANACAVRGDHQAAQQWYAYSTNQSNVFRGPRMIANAPTPTPPVQNVSPPLYQQQAPLQQPAPIQQQAPPQFAQQQPIPGTAPYEAPRQDPVPFQQPQSPMNPNPGAMAYQPGSVPVENPDAGGLLRPQVPTSPFAQYGEASSGFTGAGAPQLPPQQEAGFAQVQEAFQAPVERSPWDRDMSMYAEQPAVAVIPEQPNDSTPIGEASLGSSSGGRNAFLTYEVDENSSNPYDSSGSVPVPMTAPEGANPWSRTPSSSSDSSSYVPPASTPSYDDAYVFQATVEEASPSQPRTFAPIERYDYQDVSPTPASNPYEEVDLTDEISAALSPLLTVAEPEAIAVPTPYDNFGYEPAVEYATFPTEVEMFIPE